MKVDYRQPQYYQNREISWLLFNARVLGEAADKQRSILERLKFIAIASANLDEFFMIRVAGLKQQQTSGFNKRDVAGLTVSEQVLKIASATRALVKDQYKLYKALVKQLPELNLCIKPANQLTPAELDWAREYFLSSIYPVITPLAIDVNQPIPFLANRSLNIAVTLTAESSQPKLAVLQVPTMLPRIVVIDSGTAVRTLVFLEDLIKQFSAYLFAGYRVKEQAVFRVTRNADLFIDEEEAEDLLAEIEKSLQQRNHGQAVRLELATPCSQDLRQSITAMLQVQPDDIYEIKGPLDLSCCAQFIELPGCQHWQPPVLTPQPAVGFLGEPDIFAAIYRHDILVHHPYESFQAVIEFVETAANDPQVLAIKQTLYRVGGDSPIVRALAQAAANGKQVTALVELKARFDEENNILWARRLEEAGCHVIYGIVGLKTHSKICLVVRKEATGIVRYLHLGTGNYNEATAKIYTDIGLFTAKAELGADASAFFNMLSGYYDPPSWHKFVVAPLGLRRRIMELIDREIEHAQAGRPARIIAKMNSLVDQQIVEKLYTASKAGVKIELIVRGICVLIPGIGGVSDHITVRSIIGQFLEHSRIIFVANGGDEQVFLSSADWMPRNFDARIELLFPIEEPTLIKQVKHILTMMLQDNARAYNLLPDGSYYKNKPRYASKIIDSHAELYRLVEETVNDKLRGKS